MSCPDSEGTRPDREEVRAIAREMFTYVSICLSKIFAKNITAMKSSKAKLQPV
jgi:hypothetical protein